jgi:hypothetical protein
MQAIKRFKYGEAMLWVGALFSGTGALNGASNAITISGLCVLAAIGVRATRQEPIIHSDDLK